MLNQECTHELQKTWFPNITDAGLNRLIELLETASPLLIHGSFSRAVPMGCLATQVAWNHPRTCNLMLEAGVTWLSRVAGLNPATSHVIRAWDRGGQHDWATRTELLALCRQEQESRQATPRSCGAEPVLVEQ